MGDAGGWQLLAVLPVVVGAVLQRVTGLGFALVASPFLVLAFGPDAGVLLVNACGAVAAAFGVIADGRHIDRRRLLGLLPGALVGVLLGVGVSGLLDRAVFEIVIGTLLAAGLVASLLVRPRAEARPSLVGSSTAGVVAGASSALAGLPGPAIAVYAGLTAWRGRGMSATLQLLFLTVSGTAIAAKALTGTAGVPDASPLFWVLLAAALAVGLVTGHFAGRIVPVRAGWIAVVVIAIAGSLATLAHGASTLLAH